MTEEEKQKLRAALVDRLRAAFKTEQEAHQAATGEELFVVAAFSFGLTQDAPIATAWPKNITTDGALAVLGCLADSVNEMLALQERSTKAGVH